LALNANTGTKVWQAAAGLDVFSPSGIAGANGVIYAGAYPTGSSRIATVYVLNATTGAQLWSYSVNGDSQSFIPTVDHGMLFIGFDFTLYAFHLPGH
nr:PQQ-like beta-propeller repeat protein [Chloroflexota bacterium]